MGKFKEMTIEIEEAARLTEELAKEEVEDCNCDQSLQLTEDLVVAVEFGMAAEEHIDKLQITISNMIGFMIENDILTIPEIEDRFKIMMKAAPEKDTSIH